MPNLTVKRVRTRQKQLSIELCPNKPINFAQLAKIPTDFLSVVWHAAAKQDLIDGFGSLEPVTLSRRLVEEFHSNVLMHLACGNLTETDVKRVLNEAKRVGVRNVLVVRGENTDNFTWKPRFKYASDLIQFIRDNYKTDFGIGIAGYPSKHPESKDIEADLQVLRQKITLGANFIITQIEFDVSKILAYVTLVREMNVSIYIGMYVIHSYAQLMSLINVCHVQLPRDVLRSVTNYRNDDVRLSEYGRRLAISMIEELDRSGEDISGVHFFSLNNFEHVRYVVERCRLFSRR